MGKWMPPYYGNSNFYFKKKAKALKAIEKHQAKIKELREVVAVCDCELAKNGDKK